MILFGPSASPYSRKVLVFAAEKGLDFEHRPGAGPASPPDPEFLAASPFRKIPALKDGDFTLSDSSAIVAYIEKVKPDPVLIPHEAKAHARAIWFDEYADTILGAAVLKIFFNRVIGPMLGLPHDPALADAAQRNELPPALNYLEGVIPASGFLVEDRLTLADISVGSVLVNLGHLQLGPDPASHPKVAAYASKLLARPSFAGLIEAERAMFANRAA